LGIGYWVLGLRPSKTPGKLNSFTLGNPIGALETT